MTQCEGAEAKTVLAQLQMLRNSLPSNVNAVYQGIERDDFMRFAMFKLPGIEDALTVRVMQNT